MDYAIFYVTLAVTAFAAITIVAVTGLKGFTGWLDFKRAELGVMSVHTAPPSTASRIDIADLKERIRKLEAIAAGVDI